jgi:hypothetical protein
MTTPGVQIAVVCDSPRHARGKVAKIATITVYEDGTWHLDEPQTRRQARLDRAVKKIEAGDVRDGENLMSGLFGMETMRCKLCGRRLGTGSGVAFGAVARVLAQSGVNVVNLARLDAMMGSEGP